MTRGAKIVIFSVVGLFLVAGIYFGFLAPSTPTSPETVTTDPIAGGEEGMSADTPSLTLSPTTPVVTGMSGAAPVTASGMDSTAFAAPTTPVGTPSSTPATTAFGPVTPTPIVAPPSAEPVFTAPAPIVTAKTPPATSTESMTTYVVKSGDTLSGIAGNWFHDVNAWPAIVKANPGMNASTLKVGQKINLPAKSSSTLTASSPAASRSAPTAVGNSSQHTVAKGETLASIADKAYGNRSSWKRIYDANKAVIGANPSALKVGMKLTIPTKN